MSKHLQAVLLHARKMDKLVPVKYLAKHGLNEMELINLEDQGIITVHRTKDNGLLLILTAAGYKKLAA